MSRAPAPMTIEASSVPAHTNPYAMGTFSPMPVNMMPQYAMPTAAQPMHAMQNMFTSMQQQPATPYGMQQPLVGQQSQNLYGMQQPLVGQQSSNPYGVPQPLIGQQSLNPYGMPQPLVGQQMTQGHPGMQNVSVLDFKPDIVAHQQAAQLQQQYNSHMNAIAAAAHPSLGLVGPDGRYMPATAATPVGVSPRFTSNPYDAVGPSTSQNGSWGSNGLHSNPVNRADSAYDSPRRNISDMSRTATSSNLASTRAALKDLIDERVPSTRALKNIIEDHVDKAVGRKVSQLAPQVAATPVVANGFHSKPQEEQRRIVGDAVRSVMSNYNVTPKNTHSDSPDSTSSSYPSRDRGPTSESRYDEEEY